MELRLSRRIWWPLCFGFAVHPVVLLQERCALWIDVFVVRPLGEEFTKVFDHNAIGLVYTVMLRLYH